MTNKLILDCPSPELVGTLLAYMDHVHTNMKSDLDQESCFDVSMRDMCDQYFDIKYSAEFESGDQTVSVVLDKVDILKVLVSHCDSKRFPFNG